MVLIMLILIGIVPTAFALNRGSRNVTVSDRLVHNIGAGGLARST
jgi:hypothetical protein